MAEKITFPLERVLALYAELGNYRAVGAALGTSESWVYYTLRGHVKVKHKTFWADKREEALALIASGTSDIALAARYHTTRSAVVSFRHGQGILRGQRTSPNPSPQRKAIIPFPDTAPPSLAMLRLAEFDAVVARALAQRTGKKEPSEGVADSSEG